MKNKVIQLLLFSGVMIALITLGAVYASGIRGNPIEKGTLTSSGKLGAGLFSVAILVWIWSMAVFYKMLSNWKNNSIFLNIIVVSNFIAMPLTFIGSIIYLSLKLQDEEPVKPSEKGEKNEK